MILSVYLELKFCLLIFLIQVEDNLDEILKTTTNVQPFVIVKSENMDNPHLTLCIDKIQIPIGYQNYYRAIEILIKVSYIFNLKYDASVYNIYNYFEAFVIQIDNAQIKSSVDRFHQFISN